MQQPGVTQFACVVLIAFALCNAIGGCAKGDQIGDVPALSGLSLGGTGSSGSDTGASGAGVDSGGTSAVASGTGTSGNATSGAATAGAISSGSATGGTSGTGTSGSAASGGATAGAISSGSATSGMTASGAATTGVASTGLASTGTASTGTASTGTAASGSGTSGVGASGTATSGTAASGAAASGAASSGNTALTVVARLNLDGPDHTGVDYPGFWSASPGSTACGPYNFTTTQTLHGTNDAPLFQGEINGNPVTCKVGTALAAGTYRVRLYFAEIYWGAGCIAVGGIGTRVFDIVLEGTTVLKNLDVFAESGGCMASTVNTNGVPVVKTFDVVVNDGILDISLPATHDRGKISALEVLGPL